MEVPVFHSDFDLAHHFQTEIGTAVSEFVLVDPLIQKAPHGIVHREHMTHHNVIDFVKLLLSYQPW